MSKLGRSFSGKELKMAEVLLENMAKSDIFDLDPWSLLDGPSLNLGI